VSGSGSDTTGGAAETAQTFNHLAESQSPAPKEVASVNSRKNGSQTTLIFGKILKYSIMPNKTTNAKAKSIVPESTGAIGIASQGKYTF
jgi:hypothetical protein